jgi:predicted Zn-ribbon and HTH transcriptional regulator
MTREEKFIELNRLYGELRPIVDRIMQIIDEPANDEEVTYTPAKPKKNKKEKPERKKALKMARHGRAGKMKNYKCRDCGAEFKSTLKKLDITCNDCGSPHID